MNTNLPEGFLARSVTLSDLEAIVDLLNIEHRWLNGTDGYELDGIRVEWESPIMNLATNTQAVFSVEGAPIGYAEFWDARAPHVSYIAYVSVHPQYFEMSIGTFLAEWLEQRALDNVARAPEGARVVLHQFVESQHTRACQLLEQAGYRNVRNSFRMQIDFDQAPAEPVLPPGIVIRAIQGEQEERQAILTTQESFMDHWGAVDEPVDDYYKRMKYFIDHDPNYDPSLWFIALDDGEIAGSSLCYPKIEEDPDMGWVGMLGVRRAWRKQGLGLALLRHSFQEFYRRGKPRAGLGVDASSLTGATRLYERAGMRVARLYHRYELELRPGQDLSLQTLENELSV